MRKKEKKCKKHTLHRDNCDTCIRKIVINQYGDMFVLSGTHGFEWTILITRYGVTTQIIYKNRANALQEFNKLTKDF